MTTGSYVFDAENTFQVFDWLWSSGQLSTNDIAYLPKLGIDVVINLALPNSSNALADEAELIALQGITYINIPVLWEQPKIKQLEQCFEMFDALKGKRIWLHCAKNKRASTFIYLYRKLCLGESDEMSSYPMKEVWQPNEVWQAFINKALTK